MKYVEQMLICSASAMLLMACQKEAVPGKELQEAGTINGRSKAPQPDDVLFYAIYKLEDGTGLALFDEDHRRMHHLAKILNEHGDHVGYFKGIAYDQLHDCTWLVTDNTTANEEDRNYLWRIPGTLPTEPVDAVVAEHVERLHDQFNEGEIITDAKDIEWMGESKITMLRNGGAAGPRLAYANPEGGVYTLEPQIPDAKALTLDCQTRIWVYGCWDQADPKGRYTPPEGCRGQLYQLDYYGNVTDAMTMGEPGFGVASDIGITPSRYCWERGMIGVNMVSMMVTSQDPDPHWSDTEVFPTIDFTSTRSPWGM